MVTTIYVQETMDEKKSLKKMLTKPLKVLFQNKKKEKQKTDEPKIENEPQIEKVIENFDKLNIEHDNELKKFNIKKIVQEDEELENFTIKIVEEERKTERTDSQSSQGSGDSGFAEKLDFDKQELQDDVLDSLKTLKIEDKETEIKEKDTEIEKNEDKDEKKKKLHTVAAARAPIRNKGDYFGQSHPYNYSDDNQFKQINQINKHTFSGGQVFIPPPIIHPEVDEALEQLLQTSPRSQNFQQTEENWVIIQELISEQSKPVQTQDILQDFDQIIPNVEFDNVQQYIQPDVQQNPIEEFELHNHLGDVTQLTDYVDDSVSVFLTPPRSENYGSPFSDSQFVSSEFSSPGRSPMNIENERFSEIPPYAPSPISDKEETPKKTMSMKQFKDLQNEIVNSFSKKSCCDLKRKSSKELFGELTKNLTTQMKNDLCVNESKLDLKTACEVLRHILKQLASKQQHEELQYKLFVLICDRILGQKPELFLDDYGLTLLKMATLCCHERPILTRYLVECVRTALKTHKHLVKGNCVFNEVDSKGNSLVIALARRGDACADVLSELVRGEAGDVPLFDVRHGNSEGYSALHVACLQHAPGASALHVAHVLLAHAGADLYQGDVKGDDTAIHLAVNSANCDLRLIMLLFKQEDRKEWKKLAHLTNRSSITPLELARNALKSSSGRTIYAQDGSKSTRQNYPQEVLDFLKKCR